MSLCLATAAVALSLAVDSFTLVWTHSVEKTEWRERWRVEGTALRLVEARVQGSGAGMDPPAEAVRQGIWWVWQPATPPLAVLRLAVSGATGRGWQLCVDTGCRDLESWLAHDGKAPAAIEISARTPCTASADGRR